MAKLPINDNNGPETIPGRPRLIDMRRNINEWNAELQRRIPRLVAAAVAGQPPSARALRRLGPEGQEAFRRHLAAEMNGIAAEVKPPQAGKEANAATPAEVNRPLLIAQPNWSDRQTTRPQSSARAWRGGILRALILVLIAIGLFHAPFEPAGLIFSILQSLKDPT